MRTIFISYNHTDEKSQYLVDFIRTNLEDTEVSTICSNNCEYCLTEEKSIIDKINKCSLFICFLDSKNQNVFFELGYALGRNKKIITIGEMGNIPFDVQNMGYLKPEISPYDLLTKVEIQLQLFDEPSPKIDLLNNNPIETIDSLFSMPDLLDNLDGREFEELVASWFRNKGFLVDQSAKDRDSGYDFIIHPFRGDLALVEVKKYKSTSRVPVSIVRQFVGSMSLERIKYGIIVSSATFPNSAKYFVKDIEPTVFLWTIEDLLNLRDIPKKAL
jgi:hypothetical protein